MTFVNKPFRSGLVSFDLMVATDINGGIARDGLIPWSGTPIGKQDQVEFKRRTLNSCVFMGRKTYESLPTSVRPLPNRVNYIITRQVSGIECVGALTSAPVYYTSSLTLALAHAAETYPERARYVIGGAEIYNLALKMCVDTIYQTIIPQSAREIAKGNLHYNCDQFFRPAQNDRTVSQVQINHFNELEIKTLVYKINKSEREYLALMREILDQPATGNRTAVATHRVFSRTLKFPMYAVDASGQRQPILPVLTTKVVYSRMVIYELLWFIRGETNTDYLIENNTTIWNGNTTREALDSRGLSKYRVGETGPIYGYQWRHWNLDYSERKNPQDTSLPIDQLSDVISMIKKDPFSRRLLVSAWNPEQIDQMALPPCHYAFQFFCNDVNVGDSVIKEISVQVNMRSADMGLGVPFNIMSYALLLHMVAHLTDRVATEVSLVMTDCHVYANHVDAISEQIARVPLAYPRFSFSPTMLACTNWDEISKCTPADFIIHAFDKHPAVKMEMVV